MPYERLASAALPFIRHSQHVAFPPTISIAAAVRLCRASAPTLPDRLPVRCRNREGEDGQLYYEMEYTVRGPSFFRHNLAVYASRNDLL